MRRGMGAVDPLRKRRCDKDDEGRDGWAGVVVGRRWHALFGGLWLSRT